jgi:NADH-quinone oxidoreductase subunit C
MRDASELFRIMGREPGGNGREIIVGAEELVAVLTTLKGMGDFVLMDIDAVDRPEHFELAYRLLDTGGEGAVGVLTVKVSADRSDPRVPSVMGVWKAADVLEREVWDLMGVRFDGRDGLKRILCRDDFEGHPLRKDFVVAPPPRFPPGAEGGVA